MASDDIKRVRVGLHDVDGEPELRVDAIENEAQNPTDPTELVPVDLDAAYARLKAQLASDPEAMHELAEAEAESAERQRAWELATESKKTKRP